MQRDLARQSNLQARTCPWLSLRCKQATITRGERQRRVRVVTDRPFGPAAAQPLGEATNRGPAAQDKAAKAVQKAAQKAPAAPPAAAPAPAKASAPHTQVGLLAACASLAHTRRWHV